MPANNSTSPEEFNRMQEEALERLREMQKRSRSMVAQPSTESQNSGHGNRSMGNNNNNNRDRVQEARTMAVREEVALRSIQGLHSPRDRHTTEEIL